MRLILKSMLRRRFRTSLTIFGVMVGIFGFVIMGALAEKMNLHAHNAVSYYGMYVWVLSNRSLFGLGGSLPMDLQKDIEKLDGVVYATPRVFGPMDLLDITSPFSACLIGGVELEPHRSQLRLLKVREGDYLPVGSHGLVLLGDMVARKYRKRVGDEIEIMGRTLTVHGVLERSNTDPDYVAFMDVNDARELLKIRADECTSFAVLPAEGADPDVLAQRIEEQREGIHTISPTKLMDYIASATSFMNSLVFGATMVAVLAGGLGIVNTMVMAVSERAREIATKKAIGAATTHLFAEFVLESVIIAVVGGALGIALGHAVAFGLNSHLGEEGVELFAVTVRLMVWAMLVAVVVGCLAGVYPALRAARMDPVRVLRST